MGKRKEHLEEKRRSREDDVIVNTNTQPSCTFSSSLQTVFGIRENALLEIGARLFSLIIIS